MSTPRPTPTTDAKPEVLAHDIIADWLPTATSVGDVSARDFAYLHHEIATALYAAEARGRVAGRVEMREKIDGLLAEFDGAIRHADWVAAGSKGMAVPFHGDFASAVRVPSVMGKLRWWSRVLRAALPDDARKGAS